MKKSILAVLAAVLLPMVIFAQNHIHTIQRGETLETIARLYGITVDQLREANPKAEQMFYFGLPLVIPRTIPVIESVPRRSLLFLPHTIAEGETFHSVARSFNVDLGVLMETNPFCIFKPGYRVLIPQSGTYSNVTGLFSSYGVATYADAPQNAEAIQTEALTRIEADPSWTTLAYLDSLCDRYGVGALPKVTFQIGHYYAFGIFDLSSSDFKNPVPILRYGRQPIDREKAIFYLNASSRTDGNLMNVLMDEDGWLFNPQVVLFNLAMFQGRGIKGFDQSMMAGIVECYPEYPYNVKDMFMDYFEGALLDKKSAREYEDALFSLSLLPMDSLFTIQSILPKEYPSHSVNEMDLSQSDIRSRADDARKKGRFSEAFYYYRRLAVAGDASADYESWRYMDEMLTDAVGRYDAALILSKNIHGSGSKKSGTIAYVSEIDKYLEDYAAEQHRIEEEKKNLAEKQAREERLRREEEVARRQRLSSGWRSFVESFAFGMYNTYYQPIPSPYMGGIGPAPAGYVQPAWITALQQSFQNDLIRQQQMDAIFKDYENNIKFQIENAMSMPIYMPPMENGTSVTDDFIERNRIRNEEREAHISEMKESFQRYSYQNCNVCHGSGTCQTCNGSGQKSAGFGLDKIMDCPNCYLEYGRRTGKCSACQGTGKKYSLK